ncbi:MAG: class I SAM-dependent methyltransferase [Candidatus Hydrogenedentota bacterium]
MKKTRGTSLKGLDISPDMIKIAKRNAEEYGLIDRVEYVQSDANMSNQIVYEFSETAKKYFKDINISIIDVF